MELLSELIRTALNTIYPESEEEMKKFFMDRALLKRIYEKNPKCFLLLKKYGTHDPLLLPVCNRNAIHDKKFIRMSYRILQKLKEKIPFDQDELESVELKLSKLLLKYDKAIPKPESYAAKKAKVTREINKLFNNR